MNVRFQTLNPSYRTPAPAPRRRTAQSGKAKGNYDTVTINGPRFTQDGEESFSRILAQRAASQLGQGAGPERVQELGQQVADGTYRPDAQKIAGKLLGLE